MVGTIRITAKTQAAADAIAAYLTATAGEPLQLDTPYQASRGDYLAYGTLELQPADVAEAQALQTRVEAAELRATVATEAAWHFYHCRDCAAGPLCSQGAILLDALRGVVPEPEAQTDPG